MPTQQMQLPCMLETTLFGKTRLMSEGPELTSSQINDGWCLPSRTFAVSKTQLQLAHILLVTSSVQYCPLQQFGPWCCMGKYSPRLLDSLVLAYPFRESQLCLD